MSMINLPCQNSTDILAEIPFISRLDACYMLGVSSSYLRSFEQQGTSLDKGYSKYFPEIGFKAKILKAHKFTPKIVYYDKNEINILYQKLSELRAYKLKMERNKKNPEFNRNI